MELIKNERFLKEYRELNEKISLVTDQKIQEELFLLLTKLVSEIKSLDSVHKELFSTNKIPSSINEQRTRIFDLRKKLHKKIEDCSRAGLINQA
jgi:hypothetical protein